MASIKRANGNEPGWDLHVKGLAAEHWFVKILKLREAKVEVKCDSRFFETGNFYIEYKCLYQGEWRPSGIAVSQAKVWVLKFGENGAALVVEKAWLRRAAVKAWNDKRRAEQKKGSHPTQGALVTMQDLINTATVTIPQNMFDESPTIY